MRAVALALFLFTAACAGPADDEKNNNPNDDNARSDMGTSDGGNMSSDGGGGDTATMPDGSAPQDSGTMSDAATTPDMNATADMATTPDMDTTMDTGDPCIDDDGDGQYVNCANYQTHPGPDCDDADPDNWDSCASCTDGDGDQWFASCDRYTTRSGPDCNDADGDNWTSCATCADADGDGWYADCDGYNGRLGPDCSDSDGDNWMSCATCVDGDQDGYWTNCDRYGGIDGPDCVDNNSNVNPGATEVQNNGIDDDCDPTTPDANCSYVPVPATNPEPGVAAGITAEHNRWRARVGTAPLTWNPTLAASATAYAQNCIWQHDANRSPDAGFSYVGENLYVSTGQPSNALLLDAVSSWASERSDYDYGDVIVNGGPVVGHYTQLAWDNTTDVGCGYAYCPSISGLSFGGTIVSCRYGPGGNYLGQTPYDFSSGVCLDLDNDDVLQGNDPDDTDRSVP